MAPSYVRFPKFISHSRPVLEHVQAAPIQCGILFDSRSCSSVFSIFPLNHVEKKKRSSYSRCLKRMGIVKKTVADGGSDAVMR